MPQDYTLRNGITVTVEDKYLGEGGEGRIFEVLHPHRYSGTVAKVLFPDKRNPERHYRIRHMITHTPKNNKDPNGHTLVTWPEEVLLKNGDFVGFLMPRVGGIDMEELCRLNLSDELPVEWEKFARNRPDAMKLRRTLCSNLAKAVHIVHSAGIYIIGDLKPENIRVMPNGLISLLDLDSCQILEKGVVRFPSRMNTIRYNPPEKITGQKEMSWDYFILAIIFYELLCGVHPFTGTASHPHEDLTSPDRLIEAGLFPHGSKGHHFRFLPFPHQTFKTLPPTIQYLFIRCFDEGIKDPSKRPTTHEWIDALTAKPSIKAFNTNRQGIIAGIEISLSWDVQHADEVEIDQGIGVVNHVDSIKLMLITTTLYKIKATNQFGTDEKTLIINTFPTPILEYLKVPIPDFNISLHVSNIRIAAPTIDVSVKLSDHGPEKIHVPLLSHDFTMPQSLPLLKKKILSLTALLEKIQQRIHP